ncbi:hypothetical protein POTOM_036355 [Populus tomentosa]|uniref:Uncharacterized protein n=1 Tax=Populus tomentosa TaxID=118781 RepID=A0A8X8CN14_POPTO|nr:hypothetical protein POTOM_036355 [Populus tomentosa]
MAHSTLEDDFKRNDLPCSTEKTKALLPLFLGFLPDLQGWVLSGSSQSTLCAVERRCKHGQGSSRGSPNGSSPLAT